MSAHIILCLALFGWLSVGGVRGQNDCKIIVGNEDLKYFACQDLVGGLKLYYNFTETDVDVAFEAEADGWLGMSFSEDSRMIGSAAIVVFGSESDVQIEDVSLVSKGPGGVSASTRQQLSFSAATIEDGTMRGRFIRPREVDGEVSVNPDTDLTILWAWSSRSTLILSDFRTHAVRFITSTQLTAESAPPEASPPPLSTAPTASPTENPSASETASPTENPSASETASPTESPSASETASPTATPSQDSAPSPTQDATDDDDDDDDDDAGASPSPEPVCFPSLATVTLEDGRTLRMDELRSGVRVLVSSGKFSDVYGFSHRQEEIISEFVRIETNSTAIELTKNHYLPVRNALTAAGDVVVGDELVLGSGETVAVIKISTVLRKGLYNPHTVEGTIVVNNILASTFTRVVHPSFAKALLAVPRALYRLGIREPLGSILYNTAPSFLPYGVLQGPSIL